MNADLSDLLRLLQNLIRLGTIAEVKGAKARVRLGPTLTTEWLKWATRRAGSTRTWSALTVGEQVIVFSPGGDLTRGIMLPALYSQEFDAPESSDTIHTTHYPDGAVVQYDHTAHALTATLAGGTATITADKVTSNAPSTICTGDLTVMKNLIVKQSATVEGVTALNGDVNAKAGTAGGVAMAVQGTVKASVGVLASAISLAAAIPALQHDPDRLLVFADEGNVVASATASLSFEYRFKLNLIVTDYAGDADAIMVALIAWLKVHQLDLMANEETRKHGIAFEVDFNNHETVDISIKLDLTERVAVKTGEAGRLDIKHLAEIQHMPAYTDEFWKLYDGDTLLAEWRTPEATA